MPIYGKIAMVFIVVIIKVAEPRIKMVTVQPRVHNIMDSWYNFIMTCVYDYLNQSRWQTECPPSC